MTYFYGYLDRKTVEIMIGAPKLGYKCIMDAYGVDLEKSKIFTFWPILGSPEWLGVWGLGLGWQGQRVLPLVRPILKLNFAKLDLDWLRFENFFYRFVDHQKKMGVGKKFPKRAGFRSGARKMRITARATWNRPWVVKIQK